MGIIYYMMFAPFQKKTSRQELGIMKMNDGGRHLAQRAIRPHGRQKDAPNPTGRRQPQVEDAEPVTVFVTLAILYYQSNVIAMSGNGTALFMENADVIAAVNGRKMNDLTHQRLENAARRFILEIPISAACCGRQSTIW
jgi:hypothetical protein